MDLDEKDKGNMDVGGSRPLEGHVRGINSEKVVNIILDSGADMSVLPMEYFTIGKPLSRKSVLKDAQGRTMKGGDLRQASLEKRFLSPCRTLRDFANGMK